MATFKDIRRLTGLSLATISKHYNGGNVREENRVAIEEAATELGYRMNTVASNLRRGRSRTVGVLLPSLANEFHMSVIAEVERALRGDGMSVIVIASHDDPVSGRSVDVLLSRMVDAIVAVPTPDVVAGLMEATAAGVPVVCFDWREDALESDRVTLDNEGAGRLAARHFLDHGHHRTALISGTASVSSLHDRARGFATHLGSAGAALEGELVLEGPLTVEQGTRAMRALLDLQERPSAVFAVNYELTLGAIIAVQESGLRLGEDISVIGFDATDLAQITRPRLTVVAQPIAGIGLAVAGMVRRRLGADKEMTEPLHEMLPANILAGASVATVHHR